jgi:hypothetical protein
MTRILKRWGAVMCVLLGALIALTGCVDVQTAIHFDGPQSGTLRLSYQLDQRAYDLGTFGSQAEARAVPVSRADFERTAAQYEGVRLQSYRSNRAEDTVRVEAELAFSSLDALEGLYARGTDTLQLEERDGGYVFRQQLSAGSKTEPSERAKRFVEEYLGSRTLTVSVSAWTAIREATPGEVAADGETASVSFSLSEVVQSSEPLSWTVRW